MRAQILTFPTLQASPPPRPTREAGYADFTLHFEPDGIRHAVSTELRTGLSIIASASDDSELRHIRRSEQNIRTGQIIERSTLRARLGSLTLDIKGGCIVCTSGAAQIEFSAGRIVNYHGEMETGIKGKTRWVNDGRVRCYIVSKGDLTQIFLTRQEFKL